MRRRKESETDKGDPKGRRCACACSKRRPETGNGVLQIFSERRAPMSDIKGMFAHPILAVSVTAPDPLHALRMYADARARQRVRRKNFKEARVFPNRIVPCWQVCSHLGSSCSSHRSLRLLASRARAAAKRCCCHGAVLGWTRVPHWHGKPKEPSGEVVSAALSSVQVRLTCESLSLNDSHLHTRLANGRNRYSQQNEQRGLSRVPLRRDTLAARARRADAAREGAKASADYLSARRARFLPHAWQHA